VMSLAHEILVLNNGMRIAEGTADEVRRHPEVLAAYLGEVADA
jgi:branched-chain amino acid transport system ATP-binding protein